MKGESELTVPQLFVTRQNSDYNSTWLVPSTFLVSYGMSFGLQELDLKLRPMADKRFGFVSNQLTLSSSVHIIESCSDSKQEFLQTCDVMHKVVLALVYLH